MNQKMNIKEVSLEEVSQMIAREGTSDIYDLGVVTLTKCSHADGEYFALSTSDGRAAVIH